MYLAAPAALIGFVPSIFKPHLLAWFVQMEQLPPILEETVIAHACDGMEFQFSHAGQEGHTAKGRISKHD
jgi:hypothetical protein